MSELFRLDRFIAESTSYTRSETKVLIKKGRVKVNGIIAKDGASKVNIASDAVSLDDEPISFVKNHYYMLYKPAGCVSATKDRISDTVLDIIKDEPGAKDLFPIGRLDKDTEGLLIISDDGALAHDLLSPRKHVDKTYIAIVDKSLSAEHMAYFKEGVDIGDDKPCLPASIEQTSFDGELPSELLESTSIDRDLAYRITICEGRYHQIKRMFEACGSKVLYLKRISMGGLTLDGKLSKGEYRPLTEDELGLLNKN